MRQKAALVMRLNPLLATLCALILSGPALAQMPPSQSSMRVATPVMAASPATAVTTGNQTPPAVSSDYIWFGNDQINEATRLIRAKREVEALEVLDDIIQLDIRLAEAHLLTGVAWLQLKDLTKAEQAFNTVLAIDRGYLGAYVYLSQIALQRNNTQQVQVYLQAIKAICRRDDCAEYRFVLNSLRSAPPAATAAK